MSDSIALMLSTEKSSLLPNSSIAYDNLDVKIATLKSDTSHLPNSMKEMSLSQPVSFPSRLANTTSKLLRIQTLHHGGIIIPAGCRKVGELKTLICKDIPLKPIDIRLIYSGKELLDDDEVSLKDVQQTSASKLFVLTKTSAVSTIRLVIKGNISKDESPCEISFPANTKVFKLKKELYQRKITSLKSNSQRLIIGGKVLHDEMLLGDYLLQSLSLQKKMVVKANAADVNSQGNDSAVVLYISKTMNIQHEVNVKCHISNSVMFNFPFSISKPTKYILEVLSRQYQLPKHFNFSLSLVLSKYTQQGTNLDHNKYLNILSHTSISNFDAKNRLVELNKSSCLIDYGITEDFKSIDIVLTKLQTQPVSMQVISPMSNSNVLVNPSNPLTTYLIPVESIHLLTRPVNESDISPSIANKLNATEKENFSCKNNGVNSSNKSFGGFKRGFLSKQDVSKKRK